MRAAFFVEHGSFEVLQNGELSEPEAQEGDVLVRVMACALNRLDLTVLKGHPAFLVDKPHVLGADVSGVIEKIGPGVTNFQVGQRVILAPGQSCFSCAPCLRGRDNLCETFSMVGAKKWGGLAERVRVSAKQVLAISDQLDFETAAAFPLTFLTAWHMLVERARVREGDKVLIIGASGGVGSAAVQIAKLKGAQVLATVSDTSKIGAIRALGADAVIDSSRESIPHVARAWTAKRGVDIALDHAGPAHWDSAIGSISPGGTLVSCGATTGPDVKVDLRYLQSREITIAGDRLGTRRELTEILSLVERKKLKPVIAKLFPLAEVRDAFQFLTSGKVIGKVLVRP